MATSNPRAALGQAPGEAGIVYGKRNNILVPGADPADTTLTTIETAAAARETDRGVEGGASVKGGAAAVGYAPDAADYVARGAERTATEY